MINKKKSPANHNDGNKKKFKFFFLLIIIIIIILAICCDSTIFNLLNFQKFPIFNINLLHRHTHIDNNLLIEVDCLFFIFCFGKKRVFPFTFFNKQTEPKKKLSGKKVILFVQHGELKTKNQTIYTVSSLKCFDKRFKLFEFIENIKNGNRKQSGQTFNIDIILKKSPKNRW